MWLYFFIRKERNIFMQNMMQYSYPQSSQSSLSLLFQFYVYIIIYRCINMKVDY